MKYSAVQQAITDARRFIALAEQLEQQTYNEKLFDNVVSGKQSGAVRRASMDLTRKLAEMRRS